MGNIGYEDFSRSERFDEIVNNLKIKTSDMIKTNNTAELIYGEKNARLKSPVVKYESIFYIT
jgi:hypothetical protein